jgi:hypothetical protein
MSTACEGAAGGFAEPQSLSVTVPAGATLLVNSIG